MANCKQMLIGRGKPQTPKVRDERIDSVKYWLMVLVIAGHVFMCKEFSNTESCVITYHWIYIFHMPLFIFISGYFSRKKIKKDLWQSIWKLLEPLLIFQTITIILKWIVKGHISLIDIITPWWVLWYLLSLIFWRLLLQIIPNKILNNKMLIISITLCVSIIAGFLPFNRCLSMQRTLSFMPFFFIGYYLRNKNLFLTNKYKTLCFIFLISTILIPIFFQQYLGNLVHADPYKNNHAALCRLFVFSISIPMSIAFINICPNTTMIAKQGKLTMQYYIYHALVIPPLMIIVSKTNIPMSFISAFFYTIAITIGIYIASYLPNFTKFTNPSTFFKNRYIKEEMRI